MGTTGARVVRAGTVLPGRIADGAITDGAVRVEGGTITAVGPRAEVAVADGDEVLEHPDATVVPGLVNSHVHLVFDAGPDPVATFRAASRDERRAGVADRAARALRSGVTTLRDLGDDGDAVFAVRDGIAAGRLPGPRIVASGPPLTVEGGHCWFFGGAVEPSAAGLRAAVERTVAAGADVVKIMVSGGHLTPGGAEMWESQFDRAAVEVVVATAHGLGRRVAAHAHGVEGIVAAVEAGVDTVEHCSWLAGPGGADDPREDVARAMAAAGIHLGVALNQDWRPFMERLGPDRGPRMLDRIRWMESLGVPVASGTDAGLSGSAFDDLVGALELYLYLGLTPARTLEIATADAADALGLGAVTGRLAPGLAADLLVVDGDPREGLEPLRTPRLVMARGELVER